MKIGKIILGILIFVATANHAHALAGNCDTNLNKTGYVTSVYLGVDDNTDQNITFNFNPENSDSLTTISVKKQVNDDIGKGTYSMLLTAMVSQAKIKIMRCYTNQLVGAGIAVSPWRP
ncbi:hypothetical protein [Paramesorhizobium deserti]|uniref:hypothetical protein n=1 Tax=Paramesorhizobium deserti TaxID=1494590 RepID=UPI00129036BC|nr:hypothetical protein [Paramesorhizobium deserti]